MGKCRTKKQFPCGVCKVQCRTDCLLCEVCEVWFHSTCERLTPSSFKTWSTIDQGYICRSCLSIDGDFDYLIGITRLEKAAKKSFDKLVAAIHREILLIDDRHFICEDSPTLTNTSTDETAEHILLNYHERNTWKALTTTGDGDCLFNAVSILVCGDETKSVELRYKTTLMMVLEEQAVLNQSSRSSIQMLSPDFRDAAKDCAKIGAYSSLWTLIALAMVIQRPIRSVYPGINGTKVLQYRTLNATFNDASHRSPITVMWSSMSIPPKSRVGKKGYFWSGNHFVALVDDRADVSSHPDASSDKPINEGNWQQTRRSSSVGFSAPPSPSIVLTNNYACLSTEEISGIDEEYPEMESQIVTESPKIIKTSTPKRSQDEMARPKRRRLSSFMSKKETSSKDQEYIAGPNKSIVPPLFEVPLDQSVQESPNISQPSDQSNAYMCSTAVDATDSSFVGENISTETKHVISKSRISFESEEEVSMDHGKVSVGGKNSGVLHNNKFMEMSESLLLLKEDETRIPLPRVPCGIKENMFFVVDNTHNEERAKLGKRREFWDDCGTWIKGTSPTSFYAVLNNKLDNLTRRDGKYCIEKRDKGARVYQLLDPQPDECDILTVHRAYSKHKCSLEYRRRITWLGNVPAGMNMSGSIAIMEYIGLFPGRSIHGNVKHLNNNNQYIRTTQTAKQETRKIIKRDSAKNVYDQLNKGEEVHDIPRNLKFVQNMKYNEKRKERQPAKDTFNRNLADHILNIEGLVYSNHPFVRVVRHADTGPSIMLYTDEQIHDIRRFCCVREGTPLGVDKTFNLGEMYLTSTVFKNNAVLRTDTGESPIFFGPSFLHGKSDFHTYNSFFSEIGSKFNDEEIENLVIGSDDETAIRKSLKRSFPGATQVVCSLHLKKNVNNYLENKVGVPSKDRKHIMDTLFGENGIAQADNSIILEQRIKDAKHVILQKAEHFQTYFENRMLPLLTDHVNYPSRVKLVTSEWTNNNAESANHLLKIGTNWKQKDVKDLIDILHSIVSSQYKDAERSLIGRGNYKLKLEYAHHRISVDVWCQKSEDDRRKQFLKFLRDKGKDQPFKVTSTNGRITIPKTPSGGKKPHQRKRMRAERSKTTTRK